MTIATEIHTNDIPMVYERFSKLIGERRWIAQERKLKQQLRGRKYLEDAYQRDYQIVYELVKCARNKGRDGRLPRGITTDSSIYAGLAFASQILAILDGLLKPQRDEIVNRVRGAIANAEDMRALRLELLVATHFARSGESVEWPEMTGGECTVDLFLPNLGELGCEVECKAMSRDKGKKIHRVVAQDFHARVKTAADKKLRGLTSNLVAVVTVPDRLPKDHQTQNKLAQAVVDAILTNSDVVLADGTSVSLAEVEAEKIAAIVSADTLGERSFAVDRATNTRNEESMLMMNGKGSFVCVVRSAKRDDLGRALRTTLKKSAKNQASTKRPLFFVVSLQDLQPEELLSLASEDLRSETSPTVLKVVANQLMDSTVCPYVVGISFLSGRAIEPRVHGQEDDALGGRSYSFVRPESEFYNEGIDEFFKLTSAQ